jgi:hypothetical protein
MHMSRRRGSHAPARLYFSYDQATGGVPVIFTFLVRTQGEPSTMGNVILVSVIAS